MSDTQTTPAGEAVTASADAPSDSIASAIGAAINEAGAEQGGAGLPPPTTSFQKVLEVVLIAISFGLALFHLYTASFGIMTGYVQSAIHWALVGGFIILTKPLKFKGGIVIDLALVLTNVYLTYYQLEIQKRMVTTAGIFSTRDYVVAVIAIVVTLAISYRVLGKILPAICLIFLAYANWGNMVPGMFRTVSFSFKRIATYLFTSGDGLYGQTLYVSAQFIFLFVLFGSILDLTGAGEFFVNLSFALAGRARGGPAQAAVYSSMLMGTINGSGAANVVTTGTFTIPLMKKTGYKPSMAGAIEAVASSGGQIMPPVMGAVAFLMSEITGIKYASIAIAALVSAILYYVTLSVMVYIYARKTGMEKPDPATLPKIGATLGSGWFYFVPLAVLVWQLFQGYSAQRAAFWAIVATIVICLIFDRKRLAPKRIVAAVKSASGGITSIAAACICAGIIMGIINLTGLGLKISGIIEALAAGRLIVALILAMITSLLLGMGLPTSAAYMVLAALVAPAIIAMGVPAIAAHLFILYFGALSTITPPVALSTFAAAGIAGAGMWETGKDAIMLASSGFIIPFIFCYNTELLLIGEPVAIILAVLTGVLGCVALSVALGGWCGAKISPVGRILLLPCAIMLIVSRPIWISFVGLAAAALVLGVEIVLHRRRTETSTA